jgi:hypothetical protein
VPEDICFNTKPEIALEQSLVTRRPQYTPFEATEHTNQGRSPPKRHAVQAMATRCSTSLQSSPYERLRYFSVTAAIEDSHAAALMDRQPSTVAFPPPPNNRNRLANSTLPFEGK